ncbi:GTP cyclohydrolase FolE2 [Derxia gummosa]|uniref:GTP cyclohydrolase FolE2 n=1 Tax=Derxia gummosa DSM 723 TaxID=1121388 RepID=A0A8B6X785_9BURK|nr:GTP cyclohydrolase FolE2 [Derxia gummosa]
MNTRDSFAAISQSIVIPDVQASHDARRVPIQKVGIKGVRYPILVATPSGDQPSVAEFAMNVALPAEQKGTHMSRFVALLEEHRGGWSAETLPAILDTMLAKLEAETGEISLTFPYFIRKTAPVSGVTSLLDYVVTLRGERKAGVTSTWVKMVAPVTSLCPCSKEISEYGAHNQRSHVTIDVELVRPFALDDIARVAEDSASAELYGLLKRVDEKHVTENAYDNPKFVEDLIRDVVSRLQQDERVGEFTVEVENFESIHNHSAYAQISGRGAAV